MANSINDHSNVSRIVGIDTVSSSLTNGKSINIKGNPVPKFVVSPWAQSSYEPDTKIEENTKTAPDAKIEPTPSENKLEQPSVLSSDTDWFDNIVPEPINVTNRHLINVSRNFGIDTGSYRTRSFDIRGHPPVPKFVISPWTKSSYEPDTKIEPSPPDTNNDWFDIMPEQLNVTNRHLINVSRPVSIDTVTASLNNPSLDIRGDTPYPKIVVPPWIQSSIETDTNKNVNMDNWSHRSHKGL